MPKKIIFNESQIEELKKLVNEGTRQLEIAEHFSVTDDTIRCICKENDIVVGMPYKCICVICGEEFRSNRKDGRTCKKVHHRNCKYCGKDFIVDRNDIRDTCSPKCYSLLKYGVEHPSASSEVKEKRVAALQAKYGVSNVSQLSDHRAKSEATMLAKYGATSWAGSEIGRKRIQSANLEKYGVKEFFQSSEARKQIEQTNLERYGFENPMQSSEVQEKQRNSLLINHGVDNPMKSSKIVEKYKENYRKKYGVVAPACREEILSKISETCQEKFGVPWACMRPEARNYSAKSKVNQAFQAMLDKNCIKYEIEFPLQNYSFDFKCGNILIEINPTITHNSAINIFPDSEPLATNYHVKKTQAAIDAGYKCINIFDWDDWNKIIDVLRAKTRIFARKCTVAEISNEEASKFINEYHIQGQCKGATCCLGLIYEDELVQVMTFGRPRYARKYDVELLRLCSKADIEVIGGASKLFAHFCKSHPSETILSYCDAAKFSGSVYTAIGMKLVNRTSPAKVWSKKSERITDNLLRQRGYDQLFGTSYGKGSSNEDLMLEHGWLPVFDCGQLVFERRVEYVQ